MSRSAIHEPYHVGDCLDDIGWSGGFLYMWNRTRERGPGCTEWCVLWFGCIYHRTFARHRHRHPNLEVISLSNIPGCPCRKWKCTPLQTHHYPALLRPHMQPHPQTPRDNPNRAEPISRRILHGCSEKKSILVPYEGRYLWRGVRAGEPLEYHDARGSGYAGDGDRCLV